MREFLGNFLVINFLLETHFSYSKLAFLTRNSLFLLETHFSYSKLAFLTRNSLFLLETHFRYSKLTFSYSKLTFLTRNSLFLLETHFSYSKLTFLTRNSLFLLETRYSKNRTPHAKKGLSTYYTAVLYLSLTQKQQAHADVHVSAGLGQIFLLLCSNFALVYVSTLVADVFSTRISYVGLL